MSTVTYEGTLTFLKHRSHEKVGSVSVTFNSISDIEDYAKKVDKLLDYLSCDSGDYIEHQFKARITRMQE